MRASPWGVDSLDPRSSAIASGCDIASGGRRMQELMATFEYIQSLHGECDWLLKNYDARKEARTGEVEALVNAKAPTLSSCSALGSRGICEHSRQYRAWRTCSCSKHTAKQHCKYYSGSVPVRIVVALAMTMS